MPATDLALLWLLGGLLAVCAEFCLPGWIVPGVAGAVSMTYGLYQLWLQGANPWAFAGLAAALAMAACAGYAGWPLWTAAAVAAAAVASAWRLPAPWAALIAPVPALVIFCLTKVAGRALANKTII